MNKNNDFKILIYLIFIIIFKTIYLLPTLCNENSNDNQNKAEVENKNISNLKQFFSPINVLLYTEIDAISPQNPQLLTKTIIGYLLIEEHPIYKNKTFRRWIIKTQENKLIPIKPTLTFLASLKKESILISLCKFRGNFIKSNKSDSLNYFVIESVEILKDTLSEQ